MPIKRAHSISIFRFFPHPTCTFSTLLDYQIFHPTRLLGTFFSRIPPYSLINFQQKSLVFKRMDSETLKLTHYFGEPSVFLQNRENLWKCNSLYYNQSDFLDRQFSALLVYLALLILIFHPTRLANFPPYSFIWPYFFLWNLLKISTLLVYLALLV